MAVRTTEHLGSGQFGTVNKGIWHSSRASRVVAIKMLQSSATGEDTVRFLQEAAINGQFRHPNIVELFGVVTVDKPVSEWLSSHANHTNTGWLTGSACTNTKRQAIPVCCCD